MGGTDPLKPLFIGYDWFSAKSSALEVILPLVKVMFAQNALCVGSIGAFQAISLHAPYELHL